MSDETTVQSQSPEPVTAAPLETTAASVAPVTAAEAPVVTPPAASQETRPAPVAAAPVAAAPVAAAPDPLTLRQERFRSLRDLMNDGFHKPETLKTLADPNDWTATIVDLVNQIKTLPVPSSDQVRDWIALATEVYNLWKQVFSHAQPVDQAFVGTLEALGRSMHGLTILGTLAQRARAHGASANLDVESFDAIVDGHQTGELIKLGIKPHDLLPLVNAVGHARNLLAAHNSR